MVAALLVVVGVAWGVAWFMTGRSPFWQVAMAALFLEAVRAEAFSAVVPAARIFARRVSRRFATVRAEIGVAA